jgi:adenylate cyclase
VVTGDIGNETRKQFSISGSAVIIAFRVEQLNKDFNSELLITGEVRTRIESAKSQLAYLGQKQSRDLQQEWMFTRWRKEGNDTNIRLT